jgi:hypothetical protein
MEAGPDYIPATGTCLVATRLKWVNSATVPRGLQEDVRSQLDYNKMAVILYTNKHTHAHRNFLSSPSLILLLTTIHYDDYHHHPRE